MNSNIKQSKRIWLGDDDSSPDSYVRFRRLFKLDKITQNIVLSLAADTEFALYINGQRIATTQFPDYPDKKTYSEIDVASYLKTGRNVIAVLVHHFGYGNATHPYCPAGLRLALELPGKASILSDQDWRVSLSESYASGKHQLLSVPIGFRFCYDATCEEDWTNTNYDDSNWESATVLPCPGKDNSWAELSPRPVPFLLEAEPLPVNVIWQGETIQLTNQQEELSPDKEAPEPFLRRRHPEEAFADWTDCWNCTRDENSSPYPIELRPGGDPLLLLPPSKGADGVSVIIDMKRETVGFLVLELQGGHSDEVVVEVHHGEHLDDGRVRSRFMNLHYRFIDSYRFGGAKEKRFVHPLRRVGARYLQLFFSGKLTQPIKLSYAGLSETTLPLPETRPFESDYALQSPLRDIAIHTLICCMHDHYEDCPWREQSLYSYDSRNQILYGYYLWGNYDFVQASLNLLAGGYKSEPGYLAICAPSEDPYLIPSYTYTWIVEVAEFVLFSGRTEFFLKHVSLIDNILNLALKRPDREHPGLYLPGDDENIWNFYEWCYELANDKQQPQALYNCYLIEALQSAARLHSWAGNMDSAKHYTDCVDLIAAAINQFFWDEQVGCYTEFLPAARSTQRHYEHLQVLMLWLGIVPGERKSSVINIIIDGKLEPCSFSSLPYFVRALMRETPETRVLVEQRLRNSFEPLLMKGATTIWELPEGGDIGRFGGSLCHGWSAIPAYFANGCNLGVYPIQPGFKEFIVKPYPGTLKHAAGRVPTPHGDITVNWKLNENTGDIDIQVSAPKELRYVVKRFPENL